MGRIKEISRRPQRHRKRNPVVYLICEGTETEIKYFKRFRSRGCHIDIIPIPSQYKAADKLVQKVGATMGTNPYYPDEGDVVWCVFDRDDNTNEMLYRAKTIADKEGYKIAFSNPAFELWFLYHFVDQRAQIESSAAVIPLLKQNGRLPNYKKNQDVYDTLLPLQSQAIERAKKRIKSLNLAGENIYSRQSNPISTVVELVEYLNSKR